MDVCRRRGPEQEDGGGFQKVGKEDGGESGVVDGEEVGLGMPLAASQSSARTRPER